jgi:hypothetical protein
MAAVGAGGKTSSSWLLNATVLDTDTTDGAAALRNLSVASVVALCALFKLCVWD